MLKAIRVLPRPRARGHTLLSMRAVGGQLLGGSVWVAGAVPYPVDRSSHRARYAPETLGDVTAGYLS